MTARPDDGRAITAEPDIGTAGRINGRPSPGRPRWRARAVPFWFLIPALALYGFVVIWPSLQGAAFSLTDWDGLSPTKDFVGLANFRELWSDDVARGAVRQTIIIAIAVTIIQNGFGLLLALGVNTQIRSRNLLRVLLFAPAVITPVITAFLWRHLLAPTGAVNDVLGAVGLGALQRDWLGNPDLALWSVVAVIVWQFAGLSMVIFLAGLQSIPREIYEAAAIDGTGPIRRFWYVVRPMLAPAITINLVLSMIGGLKLFDQVWVMTGGGPGRATETLSTLLYKEAFQFGAFGYSIALAIVLTAFVAVLASVQYGFLRRQEESAQ
ncbi:carbohydrate ABC transporter permease [Phytoactinopolyspora halophila]|uniref:carbohydrate ABC transporter permease n=1 Tax=Phytoactinopolyspora halophila TaxID=1981511 RepID=UPI001B8AF2BB|nr:sugar ABC transporter permease [Phytoactinopolyspora halophila]